MPSDMDQQILKEFAEIVDVISAKVMEVTVAPAFREEVAHWTKEAEIRIDKLQELLKQNSLFLSKLTQDSVEPINRAILALNNNKEDFKQLFEQAGQLEQSLTRINETNNLTDKLQEINEGVRRLSLLLRQIEIRSAEYQKAFLEQQKELLNIRRSFSSEAETAIFELKKASQALLITAEKVNVGNLDIKQDLKDVETLLLSKLSEIETKVNSSLEDLNDKAVFLQDNLSKMQENNLENVIRERLESLYTEIVSQNLLRQKAEEAIKAREEQLQKKLDGLTIALIITSTISITLLGWMIFF
mgnify:CR=1 FL=1